MAIGKDTMGHQTLYWGAEHVKSTNGGDTWTEMSSSLYTGGDSFAGTWQANGDTNDVDTYAVIVDNRGGRNWLYYGDDDNFLLVSYNGGISFSPEGWQWSSLSQPVFGDGATSIVLDSSNSDGISVGVSNGGTFRFNQDDTVTGGVVQGVYTQNPPLPAVPRWIWNPLGNQLSFPHTSGPIDLLQDTNGDFFVAAYGRGVYKHVGGGTAGNWICLGGTDASCANANQNNWTSLSTSPPACGNDQVCWKAYRIYQEPVDHRLYVVFGNPLGIPPVQGETGIWESPDGGTTWKRISNPSSDPAIPESMDKEPVTDLVFTSPTTILATTKGTFGPGGSLDQNGNYVGDGGIYRGTCTDTSPQDGHCDSNATWSWTKVLAQPVVAALVVSRASSSIIYAYVAQNGGLNYVTGQKAGIYKSTDGGITFPMGANPIANDGLMNFDVGRLYTSPIPADIHKLYASTLGDGVFAGMINCGPLSEGFPGPDGDGDGYGDTCDNCPSVYNPTQADADADGIGDACDTCTDTDHDNFGNPGYSGNTCTVDNCPTTYNPTQTDADADGLGDACDTCIDRDRDGYGDPQFANITCTADCLDTDASVHPGAIEGVSSLTTCSDGKDNDCDGVIDLDCGTNASAQPVAFGGGNPSPPLTITGTFANLGAVPDDFQPNNLRYETITETGTKSTNKAMTKVWTFSGLTTGLFYQLRMEGFKSPSDTETFSFSYKTIAAPPCDNSGTFNSFSPALTVTDTSDNDTIRTGAVGQVTASAPVVCIRLTDGAGDSQVSTITLDRLFLFPLPPCTDADNDGYAASCASCNNALCPAVDCNDSDATINPAAAEGPIGSPSCSDHSDNNCNGLVDGADNGCMVLASADVPTNPPNLGSIISGTNYLSTQASDDVREGFQEALFGNTSALYQTWRFDNVPLGSTHKLHFEGYRPNNNDTDNFEFGWSTTATGAFNAIGATISSPTEIAGGTDSPAFGPANFSGTLYIFIRDTNRAANKKSLDTVFIDHLGIKTFP